MEKPIETFTLDSEHFRVRVEIHYDPYPDNPQEAWDGEGKVYSSRWGDPKAEHHKMQKALGLNEDWQPNLDLVADQAVKNICLKLIQGEYPEDLEFYRGEIHPNALEGLDEGEQYEALLDHIQGEIHSWSPRWTDRLEDEAQRLWQEGINNGTIGDPYAVVLDCYQHGCIVWSVSGEGMQDQWDTALGVGVWVPDEAARVAIDARAKVYAYGKVWQVQLKTRAPWFAQLDGSEEQHEFPNQYAAYWWLKSQTPIGEPDLRRGLVRAKVEYARPCLETYNQWLNGEVYGYRILIVAKDAEGDETGDYSVVDSSWGFFGFDYATEEAQTAAKCALDEAEAVFRQEIENAQTHLWGDL